VQLPERCYAMDAKGPLMVVGTAEKHVCIFDLNNPTVIFKVKSATRGMISTSDTYPISRIAINITFKMANACSILFLG
jgi:mRNA export factor